MRSFAHELRIYSGSSLGTLRRTADAEVTDDLVATVVGADDLDRQTGHGNRQVVERHGEIADLEISGKDDIDPSRRLRCAELDEPCPQYARKQFGLKMVLESL